MLRRHLLAQGATATFGATIKGLGELLAQLGDTPSRRRHGEPRGLQLAHGAITAVTKLSAVRARWRLEPLAVKGQGQGEGPLARTVQMVPTR